MKIVILGNGIAGVTCARHLRKLDSSLDILIISGESDFHYSRPALMYLFMGHMRYPDLKPYEDWFWEENRLQLKRGWVETINFKVKTLHFRDETEETYDVLVLATGSQTSYYKWPGQDLDGVHGMVTLDDIAAMERHAQKGIQQAVIVGGGLIGVEMAECLHTRQIPVKFLIREASYWDKVLPPQESTMVSRHIGSKHGIELLFETELSEIWGDKRDGVTAVALKGGNKIPCQFVGIATGVKANVDFLRTTELEIDKGILVDDYLRTNIEGVFAVGDCSQMRDPQPDRKNIEAIWYTARMQGETLAHNILGKQLPYRPGVYFNSAKFFDIEYQVYGQVPAELPADRAWYYWEHEGGEKSVRLYWEKESGAVTGFHLMGIRFRQEICETWMLNKVNIQEVVANLGLANFDPEFYEEYEPAFVSGFNAQEGTSVKLATRRGLPAVQRFLKRFRKTSPPIIAQRHVKSNRNHV